MESTAPQSIVRFEIPPGKVVFEKLATIVYASSLELPPRRHSTPAPAVVPAGMMGRLMSKSPAAPWVSLEAALTSGPAASQTAFAIKTSSIITPRAATLLSDTMRHLNRAVCPLAAG